MAKCLKVVNPSTEETVWDPSSSPSETLFISCTQVSNSSGSLLGHDCLNASLVQTSSLRNDSSLAQLMDSYYHPSSRRLPKMNDLQVPHESDLVIYNRSKLLVNLEVNILRVRCTAVQPIMPVIRTEMSSAILHILLNKQYRFSNQQVQF